ncbi:ABC transporter ATP-binding protein [Breznakiella homolactica]|uniref:ABC transporter ATP-binding protein n=1 Tax=Breznakiella homolactica TaxID=2798577 RepID=A0A7T7XL36_9SPIR|nr:ABC transporter ATP-binding protein [Breznakiella homolactica]QQO08356.1 ABC transporter ATP-binding protein [Breznakiella homolactica]
MVPVLEVEDLTKNYITKKALNGVSFTLEKGRILGLAGPNGSGKTTLLKILAGLQKASGGTFRVQGSSKLIETKERVSFLPDRNILYPWMKASDAIDFYGDFFADFDRSKAADMLGFMRLDAGERVKNMSKGMVEKLNLVLAFSRKASLYLLDEPLGGIDPVAREQIVSAIIKTWSEDSAIIISTHLLSDVEQLFNEVALIDAGEIILTGDAEALRIERGRSIIQLYIDIFGNR